jgi:phage shock protein A
MINEKYNDLLIAIAELIAAKNDRIDQLHDEINELKSKLDEAEQNVMRVLAQKGK